MSRELQQLGHPKFVWYFDLNLATCSQSLEFEQETVLKCLKSEKQSNLTFIISRTATARASKVCVVLCLELRSTFPKFGVWTTHSLEILKVRKIVNMTYLSKIPWIYYISVDMTLQDPRQIRKRFFGNDIFMSCDKLCFKFFCMNLDIGQIYQPKSW